MNTRSRILALLAGVGLGALGGGAFAQTASAQTASARPAPVQTEDTADVEDIVVTGSRVIRNGDASPSPVTVVSTEEALRVQPGTLADALAILPVFAGNRGSGSNPTSTGSVGAGNAGANSLNLRNVGANRTLVLLDGLRVPPTLLNGVVDVDVIPQALVQRVDTVTGGVSAVYGSDAISGVVNYVLDKNLNGLRATVSTGISEESDAAKQNISIAGGTRLLDGRAHVEGSYEYRDDEGIPYRSDRDFMNIWGVAGAGTTANPFVLYSDVRQATFPFGGLITSGVLTGQTFATDGVLRPIVHGTATGSAALEVGGDGGYYDSSLLAALESQQIFGRFDFDISDHVHAYAQVSGNLKTNSNSSDYVRLTNVTMNSSNPFLAQTYRNQLATALQPTFRLSELLRAPRLEAVTDSDQWIYMGGLNGDFGAGYKWSLDLVHGTTDMDTTLNNNVNNQRLAAALDAVQNGSTVSCSITVTNPTLANGCVPLNVFGPTAASAEALAWVLQSTHYSARTVMDSASAHVDGSPFSTWAGPVAVAVSAEWRKLSFSSVSDALPSAIVDCTGLRYNCTAGGALWANTYASSPEVSQTVKEVAFEFDAPFVQAFSVNGAARFTSYDTSGDYWTWKIGADWRINDSFRLRATRSRDIRAPTLYELFAPTNSVPVTTQDLLTTLSPTVPSTDLSNPNLTAEIGDTSTAGFIWKPIDGLSVALDGYHITISDAVTQINGATAAYQRACYDSGGTSEFCALQVRPNGYTSTAASNAVTRWYTKYMNIAEVETYGADLEVNYAATLFDRPAAFRFLAAYQPHVTYSQPGVTTTDQGGVAFGPLGAAAGPDLRLTALFRFEPIDNLHVDVMQRWRDVMQLGGDPTQVWVSNRLDAFATTNLNLSYQARTAIGSTEVFLNVSNLFNAEAPGGAYALNGTRAGLRDGYAMGDDVLGRYFTVGVRLKL